MNKLEYGLKIIAVILISMIFSIYGNYAFSEVYFADENSARELTEDEVISLVIHLHETTFESKVEKGINLQFLMSNYDNESGVNYTISKVYTPRSFFMSSDLNEIPDEWYDNDITWVHLREYFGMLYVENEQLRIRTYKSQNLPSGKLTRISFSRNPVNQKFEGIFKGMFTVNHIDIDRQIDQWKFYGFLDENFSAYLLLVSGQFENPLHQGTFNVDVDFSILMAHITNLNENPYVKNIVQISDYNAMNSPLASVIRIDHRDPQVKYLSIDKFSNYERVNKDFSIPLIRESGVSKNFDSKILQKFNSDSNGEFLTKLFKFLDNMSDGFTDFFQEEKTGIALDNHEISKILEVYPLIDWQDILPVHMLDIRDIEENFPRYNNLIENFHGEELMEIFKGDLFYGEYEAIKFLDSFGLLESMIRFVDDEE